MQNIRFNLLKPVLFSLIIMLLGTGFAVSSEINDSSLFVDAFTAYQDKDYLLSIEIIETLQQLFPDTPLRDVALLLLARAGLKSGNLDLAAITVNRFNREFNASPFKAFSEEELQQLGLRGQKGGILSPSMPLSTATRNTRNDQPAMGGRSHQIPAGSTPSVETVAQNAVKAAIRLTGRELTVAVGQSGSIPFEIVNLGSRDEETFVLEVSAPPQYGAVLTTDGTPTEKSARVTVSSAVPYKSSIAFHMPVNKTDGHKTSISLQIFSESERRIFKEQEAQVITAAPSVRVLARPENQKPAKGEQVRYHITILNAGTLPARKLNLRLLLPDQIEFMAAHGTPYRREGADAVVLTIDRLSVGSQEELTLDVKVRENCRAGQEVRLRIEVLHGLLMLKETFTSAAIEIREK